MKNIRKPFFISIIRIPGSMTRSLLSYGLRLASVFAKASTDKRQPKPVGAKAGRRYGIRTHDPLIKSQMLYQLS
jgi:hypothetical protein